MQTLKRYSTATMARPGKLCGELSSGLLATLSCPATATVSNDGATPGESGCARPIAARRGFLSDSRLFMRRMSCRCDFLLVGGLETC